MGTYRTVLIGMARGSGAYHWRTHRGVIDVDEVCPRAVAALVSEATERSLWRGMVAAEPGLASIGPTPLMGPLLRLLQPGSRGPAWGPREQGCLSMAITGGWWSQQRRFAAGLVDSPLCKACGQQSLQAYACKIVNCFAESESEWHFP